ncbi:MAG: Rpn family recombination-promoting nuclease/putative transposase [Muribaculaceae bacterium]|nr:Rpn family recombination-promoting nuclease/putative transposase [Muribaculaceae bacterium]
MAKYINPFTDTGFKVIFGKENQSEEILRSFLNDLFFNQPLFDPITELHYSNNERVRENPAGKTIIHDVICTTSSGHKFILEMQNSKHDDFLFRSTYYTYRGVTDQISISNPNRRKYHFYPVVSVFMCNFNVPDLEKKLVSHFVTKDTETDFILKTGVRSAYIQLPEFNKTWEECTDNFDKWIFILKTMYTKQQFPKMSRKDEVFERLEKVSNYAALTSEEQVAYEADLLWIHDYEEGIETARRDAIKEGLEKGIEEGRAIGRAIGKAEGKVEEKWEMAKNLFSLGIDLETIAKASNLPIEELKNKLLS